MTSIKNKSLLFIIGVLLISNLVMVGMYLFGTKERRPRVRTQRSPIEFMVKELSLDDKQAAAFKEMLDTVKQKNKPLLDSMRTSRESLYKNLKAEPQPDSVILSYANTIGKIETELTINNYEHFRKLRAMCNPEQQLELDTLIQRMGRRTARKKGQ
ncbi:Spy/CpxP family protein refolding chaperone [Flavihumibacter sp. ZG627]|uniref:Spy/CpxP family protein refolding chaperone n=1 Tax=Flavihumibacter sp. ZG627 TaxID=1463156 RepID=UPI00057D63A1|nr:Spy/CpxP family protein refolding chaperone [Flavihumibacter sp. ZG627]KIC92549.1 hypothetical protein HY58_03190 [Flavihumibacter sp. ZG627]